MPGHILDIFQFNLVRLLQGIYFLVQYNCWNHILLLLILFGSNHLLICWMVIVLVSANLKAFWGFDLQCASFFQLFSFCLLGRRRLLLLLQSLLHFKLEKFIISPTIEREVMYLGIQIQFRLNVFPVVILTFDWLPWRFLWYVAAAIDIVIIHELHQLFGRIIGLLAVRVRGASDFELQLFI